MDTRHHGPDDGTAAGVGLHAISSGLQSGDRFIMRDPAQLSGQFLGRIPAEDHPELEAFLLAARSPRSPLWLRPVRATMARTDGPRTVLSGHNNAVSALAVTPDGRLLVSASWDRTVRVWDLERGRPVHVLTGHDEYVETLAVSPDGRWVASGSVDGTVRVWDLGSGAEDAVLPVGEPVVAVAAHPDGDRLAVASPSRVSLWSRRAARRLAIVAGDEVATDGDGLGGLRWSLSGRNGMVVMGMPHWFASVAISPEGGRLYAGRVGGELAWWPLDDPVTQGGSYRVLPAGNDVGGTGAHRGPVWAIVPTPDGTAVVSGGGDGVARVWDRDSARLRWTLEGHDGPVIAAAVTPDGARVMTGSRDATVRIWDLATGTEVGVLRGHGSGVDSLASTPDGTMVASGSDDRSVRLWALPGPASPGPQREPVVLSGHGEGVMGVAALAGEVERVASASQDRTVKVWDVRARRAVLTLEGHEADVLAVVATPDGRRLVSAGDTTLRVWDAATGDEVARWEAHPGGALCVAMSTNGDRILSGGDEGTIGLRELPSGRLLREVRAPSPVMAVALSPDGSRGLAGTEEGSVLLVDLDRGVALPVGPAQRSWIRAVSFVHDGAWAVAGGGEGTTRVWDLESGATVWDLDGGHGPVGAVLELGDGSLAVSSVDGTVVVWNLESGEATGTVHAHDGPVGALALLADGRVVSGSGDKTVRILAPVAFEEVETPRHTDSVNGLGMSQGGDAVFSASADRTLRVWDPRGGEPIGVVGGSGEPLWALDMARDGRTLVTLSADGTLAVWDALRRQHVHSWTLETRATSMAVTPDGERALLGRVEGVITVVALDRGVVLREIELEETGSFSGVLDLTVVGDGSILVLQPDAAVRILDLGTGAERGRMVGRPGHEGFLFSGPIAADRRGRWAASVAVQLNDERIHDNPIRVWDLSTRDQIGELRGHTDWVRGLTFAGDDRIISASQDGSVRVWDVRTSRTIAALGTDDRLLSVASDASGTVIAAGGSGGALHFLRLESDARAAT